MRLFWLELRRILKTRRTWGLLLAGLLLAAAMAYLPTAYEGVNYLDENGNVVELNGVKALKFRREIYRENADRISGPVTPEKLRSALEQYQEAEREYGTVDGADFPLDVYLQKILPIRPLLSRLPETYADPVSGNATPLSEIDPEKLDGFYEQCQAHLTDVMELEHKEEPGIAAHAKALYQKVKTPFELYPGYSSNAFEYLGLTAFLLMLLYVGIAAPLFSREYQNGADSIQRCTKNGRTRLAVTRILAFFTVTAVSYGAAMAVYLGLSTWFLGTECLQTSLQMEFSMVSLPNLNLWEAELLVAAAGLFSVLSMTGCALFLSAAFREPLSSLFAALALSLAPSFAYAAAGTNWISALLPSGGLGMQNSFLYHLVDIQYLTIGDGGFWVPEVILAAAVVEIPVFFALAVRAYVRHTL